MESRKKGRREEGKKEGRTPLQQQKPKSPYFVCFWSMINSKQTK